MPVDLAHTAMACKLVTRPSGRPGRVLSGTDEGGQSFRQGRAPVYLAGVRRLGFGIHLPSRRRLWFPPRRRRRIASVKVPARHINQGSDSTGPLGAGRRLSKVSLSFQLFPYVVLRFLSF